MAGKRVLITGSGRTARSVAKKLLEYGAVPITMSDTSGHVYEPDVGFSFGDVCIPDALLDLVLGVRFVCVESRVFFCARPLRMISRAENSKTTRRRSQEPRHSYT